MDFRIVSTAASTRNAMGLHGAPNTLTLAEMPKKERKKEETLSANLRRE